MPKKRKTPQLPDYLKDLPEVPNLLDPKSTQKDLDQFNKNLMQRKQDRRDIIELLRKHYERTGNPLFVWDAYSHARKLPPLPIPEWIFKYFDDTAKMLLNSKNQTHDMARYLGFKTIGGGRGPFLQYKNQQIKIFAVNAVNKLLQNPDTSVEDACEKVIEKIKERWGDGNEFDLFTIRRWYYETKDWPG